MNMIKNIGILLAVFFSHTLKAQDCEYLTNERDDFTGDLKQIVKSQIYKNKTYQEAHLIIKRINNEYTIQIEHFNSTLLLAEPFSYSAEADDKLMLKLNDNSVLQFPLKSEFCHSRSEQEEHGVQIAMGGWANFTKKNKIIFEPEFVAEPGQLEDLAIKEIVKVRIEAKGSNIHTREPVENLEFSIDNPIYREQVKEKVKCILL